MVANSLTFPAVKWAKFKCQGLSRKSADRCCSLLPPLPPQGPQEGGGLSGCPAALHHLGEPLGLGWGGCFSRVVPEPGTPQQEPCHGCGQGANSAFLGLFVQAPSCLVLGYLRPGTEDTAGWPGSLWCHLPGSLWCRLPVCMWAQALLLSGSCWGRSSCG